MFWRHGIKFKDGKQTIRTTTGTLHEDWDTDSEDELAIQNSDTEDKKTNESAPDRQKALHI